MRAIFSNEQLTVISKRLQASLEQYKAYEKISQGMTQVDPQ